MVKVVCQVVWVYGVDKVVLVVLIGLDDIVVRFVGYVDEVVCLVMLVLFFVVGQGYCNFIQIFDDEVVVFLDCVYCDFVEVGVIDVVVDLLFCDEEVQVVVGLVLVVGYLIVFEKFRGIVVFVYGSGSSWYSICNWYVVEVLIGVGFVMLLFDLFMFEEECNCVNVFDIELFVF